MLSRTLLILLISTATLSAQINDSLVGLQLEALLEQYAFQNEGAQFDEILDYTQRMRARPVNLNSASKEELLAIPFLDLFQVHALLEYRRRNGRILTFYELTEVKGLSKELLMILMEFCYIGEPEFSPMSFKGAFKQAKGMISSRWQQKLELPAGYYSNDTPSAYLGAPFYWQNQLQYDAADRFNLKLNLEKDAGESMSTKYAPYLFDHQSFYLRFGEVWKFNQIILGDYHVKIGQGLNKWSGFGIMNQIIPKQNIRKNQGLRPYAGNEENKHFRGLSVELQHQKHFLNIYLSQMPRDASLTDDQYIQSLNADGLHNTMSSLARKDAAVRGDWGIYYQFKSKSGEVGVAFTQTQFNKDLLESEQLEYVHRPSGSTFHTFSIDAGKLWQKVLLFGEAAVNKEGALALIGGLSYHKHPFSTYLSFRNYQNGYQSFDEGGLRRFHSGIGEIGIMGSSSIMLSDQWKFLLNYDFYKSHWATSQSVLPLEGIQLQGQLEFSNGWTHQAYLRGQYRSKSSYTEGQNYYNLRLQYRFRSGLWSSTNRAEFNLFDQSGYLLQQSLQYQIPAQWLRLSAAVTLFKATTYENRFYQYEQDLMNSFYIPALYGEGIRWFIMAHMNMGPRWKFRAKIQQNSYPEPRTQGSGNSLLSSKTFSTLKLQLQYRI